MGPPRAHSRRARSAAANSVSNPAELLGKKVSFYFATPNDPEFGHSEAVGVVQRIDDDRGFHVLKRDGTVVTIPAANVVKMKIIGTS